MNRDCQWFADGCWGGPNGQEVHIGDELDEYDYKYFKAFGRPMRNLNDHTDLSNEAWLKKVEESLKDEHFHDRCFCYE